MMKQRNEKSRNLSPPSKIKSKTDEKKKLKPSKASRKDDSSVKDVPTAPPPPPGEQNDPSVPTLTQPSSQAYTTKPSYILPPDQDSSKIVHFSLEQRAYVTPFFDEKSLFGAATSPGQQEEETKEPSVIVTETTNKDDSKERNALSFVHRSIQTSHWPSKDHGTATESKPTKTSSGSCSSWEIHDAYKRKAFSSSSSSSSSSLPPPRVDSSPDTTAHAMQQTLKVIERMAFQNLHQELIADFKYWDDPADAARPDEGTLLPLWSFSPATASGRAVTALLWSPKHADVFAVGYGAFNPVQQVSGLVCLYSLANADSPECQISLPSGVLALDFHPKMPFLLSVGCQDGSVHVINTATSTLLASCSHTERHKDQVWQVRWLQPFSLRNASQFLSTSSDGIVIHWDLCIGSGTLRRSSAMSLSGAHPSIPTVSPSCFDVHPLQPSLMLLGTHEGIVLRCSTDVGPSSLEAFPSSSSTTSPTAKQSNNAMPIYTVAWNPLHPSTFLTASFDWNIRIWDSTNTGEEVFRFNAGSPVADASWSPFSPTVFAAATETGKVLVYDLDHSMDFPLCKQKVAQKIKLTKIAFNPHQHPILLVGDEKGRVMCFELSPNLKKCTEKGADGKSKNATNKKQQSMSKVLHIGECKNEAEKKGYSIMAMALAAGK